MATRKTTASKATSAMPTIQKATKSRRGKKARSVTRAAADMMGKATRKGSRGFDVGSYIAPGAAVLASGALAAAGYIFKEQLGDVMVDVLKVATKQGTKAAYATSKVMDATRDQAMDAVEKISDKVSVDAILRYAGLQRRSTVMSIVGPAIGVTCGVVAGAALTYFFGPQIFGQLKAATESASTPDTASHDDEDHVTSTSSAVGEVRSANGGLHRGIS